MSEVDNATRSRQEEVEAAFPELELINDVALRSKVAAIWAETLSESAWDSLSEVPKNPETLPSARHLVEHSRSVALQALAVAEAIQRVHGIPFKHDELVAASLLHDVSKLVEYEPAPGGAGKSKTGKRIQHGVLGAFKAMQYGLSEDLVHNIIVHTHNSKYLPQTWEAIVVHYVDYLDSDALLFAEGKPLLLKK